MNLCSTSRAQQNATLAALSTDTLNAKIASASRAIERYCKRYFALQSYVEFLSGGGQPYDLIQLSQFPVQSISRLATCPRPVLTVQNTDPVTNQRATIAVTQSSVQLLRVASAAPTPTTLAFASYTTLTAMANAIVALGNGWTATPKTGYELWSSADLRPLQGAVTCIKGPAQIESYVEELDPWSAGGSWGGDDFGYVGCGPGWRLSHSSGELIGRFPPGQLNLRCDYVAGYASDPDSLPPDIQEACVLFAKDLSNANDTDYTQSSVKIGPYSESSAGPLPAMSAAVKSLLAPYVDHSKLLRAADRV